jgi:hypothetical protein
LSNPTAAAEKFQAILNDVREDEVALKVKEEATYRCVYLRSGVS